MDVPRVLPVADAEDVLAGLRLETPSAERVVTPGQGGRFGILNPRVKELAADAGVRGEVDRAVGRPAGSGHLVGHRFVEQPVRAAAGRNQKDVVVEIGLEVGARVRDEEDPGPVGGELGAALADGVVGELQRIPAVGIHDPDLTFVPVVEERRRCPHVGDPAAVVGDAELHDRIVPFGHALRLHRPLAGEGSPEQVPLLVVLVEREHIVLEFILSLLLGRLGIGGDEVELAAVRGEGEPLHRAVVIGQCGRFATAVPHPVDLGEGALSPTGQKCHPFPVRGPAWTGLAVFAVREPDLSGPVGVDTVDVGGPAVLLPVGVRSGVEQLGAVGGEPGTAHRGNLDEVHDGHGSLLLGALGECGNPRQDQKRGRNGTEPAGEPTGVAHDNLLWKGEIVRPRAGTLQPGPDFRPARARIGPGPEERMRIGITGATGLIGRALAADLALRNHQLTAFSRSEGPAPGLPARTTVVRWNPEAAPGGQPAGFSDGVSGLDILVHLAGQPISKRWTAAQKEAIRTSRVQGTARLVAALAALEPRQRPTRLLAASAVGYYGPRGDEELGEDDAAGTGFLADVCSAWEEAAGTARREGIETSCLRFGVVLSPQGGALAAMLPPFRLGLGGRVGSGRQWMPWIHLADAAGAVVHLAEAEPGSLAPAYNLTAPEPVRNAAFAKTLARALKRPALFPAPAFAMRLALGEMAEGLLLTGQRVVPRQLSRDGFRFRHPQLRDALADLLAAR